MRIVVPMAGRGSRLRPHTLTVPKPLVPIAGSPIVERLVTSIAKVCEEKIEEIAFVIGDFGAEVEQNLISVAEDLGAKGTIYHQDEALGTAHAILCAADSLEGNVVVAFADTLFRADFKLNAESDGIIWVSQIDDPSAFGVVQLDEDNVITDYVEKPEEFVSDLAMIGIYYFKDGAILKSELQYLIDNNVIKGGEYQLPDALRNMTEKGAKFTTGKVEEWLDCGNKKVTVYTNQRILEHLQEDGELSMNDVELDNSIVVPPCFIGKGVRIKNSIIGPHVSLGANSSVENSIIKNSLIQENTSINGVHWEDAMIGNKVEVEVKPDSPSFGDFTQLK